MESNYYYVLSDVDDTLHLYLYDYKDMATLDEVQKLVEEDPRRLFHKDEDGLLPIHVACIVACINQAPLEVIQFLVEQYPEGLQETDTNGCLPLHRFCWSTKMDNAEFTKVLEYLIKMYPQGIRHADYGGRLPLHCACLNYDVCEDNIRLLIDAYPDAIRTKNKFGELPIDLAMKYGSPAMVLLVEAKSDVPKESFLNALMKDHGYDDEYRNEDDLFDRFYAALPNDVIFSLLVNTPIELFKTRSSTYRLKIMKTIRERYCKMLNVPNDHGRLPLHNAIRQNAPWDMVHFTMEKYPAGIFLVDNDGLLPLHLAFMYRPKPTRNSEEQDDQDASDRDSEDDSHSEEQRIISPYIRDNGNFQLIKILLEIYPKAARERCTNKGRLPLHYYACASHMDINQSQEVLNLLIHHHADGMEQSDRDGNTPLVLACADENENASLDVIFLMMRSNPSILQNAIPFTA